LTKFWVLPAACAGALLMSGCHKKDDAANSSATAEATATATPEAAEASPTASPTATPAPAAPFDMAKIPVSEVQLGAFPYLSLPAGYKPRGEKTLEISRYPVLVGDHFQWVEGKVYDAGITNDQGKDFSLYELQKNIETLIAQTGGTKVYEGKPTSETLEAVKDARQAFDDSVSDLGSGTVQVYLIHQQGRDIWVQMVANDSYGAWGIVEAKPFEASAKLISAEAPKAQ
jgi:OOP family OmpA-OmpF porin